MAAQRNVPKHRSRELRRRVVLPARLRTGTQWSDTCILNISSRGLMILSGRVSPKDSLVELRRGEHVIIARVVWRDGGRVGLQSKDRVPVEEIISTDRVPLLRLTVDGHPIERRRRSREPSVTARSQGRIMEFIAVGLIATSLVTAAWQMTGQALARPLVLVASALGP